MTGITDSHEVIILMVYIYVLFQIFGFVWLHHDRMIFPATGSSSPNREKISLTFLDGGVRRT